MRLANEFAVVFSFGSIVASIIPVNGGNIKPPQKRSSQRSKSKTQKLLMNGIGAAQRRQRMASEQVTTIVFGAEYPPRAVVTLPPTITPTTGPVMLMMPKAVNAYV